MLFEVEELYPIENGIIAKVRYDREKLFFDPTNIRKDATSGSMGGSSSKEWSYMTINDHPLDDIHPLAIQSMSPLMEGQKP